MQASEPGTGEQALVKKEQEFRRSARAVRCLRACTFVLVAVTMG